MFWLVVVGSVINGANPVLLYSYIEDIHEHQSEINKHCTSYILPYDFITLDRMDLERYDQFPLKSAKIKL